MKRYASPCLMCGSMRGLRGSARPLQKEGVGAFLFLELVVEVPSCVRSMAKGERRKKSRSKFDFIRLERSC